MRRSKIQVITQSFWGGDCSTKHACGILVPQPGIEPMSPEVEAWSLNHWTTRDVLENCIYIYICVCVCVYTYFLIILFISGCAESSLLLRLFSSCSERRLLSSCGPWASHCGGFSYCRVWVGGCAGFSSCSSWALEHKFKSCGARI